MKGEAKPYYDAMSERYDRGRDSAYHRFIDLREARILRRLAGGIPGHGLILDAGCGTGLILNHIPDIRGRLVGCDISPKMSRIAKGRGERVILSSLTDLPFKDCSFHLVFSFKVLPHIEDMERAVSELVRVTKRGGILLLEFYNTLSLRFLVKSVTSWQRSSSLFRERDIATRYLTPRQVMGLLPHSVELMGRDGIRIITPSGLLWRIEPFRFLLERCEDLLSRTPARDLAGFILLSMRRV